MIKISTRIPMDWERSNLITIDKDDQNQINHNYKFSLEFLNNNNSLI